MPRIYVRSLPDYNAGVLVGDWIDIDGLDEIEIQDEINVILRQSRFPNVTVECPECEGSGNCVVHSLRHTCATRLIRATGNIYLVKEWLGHSSVVTTDSIYAHVERDNLLEAADKLAALNSQKRRA